ncbi:hypothetical protein B9G98_02556 [Wickerhamiella sorbophila]|uniref:ATP synthase subunit H, mitochondrial n=1 Tax=Wickerhamiella sorbophila TaxID=45607 RepID=A0A2T0FIY9_9ASCO|nr:hypothetical protein B9G98_02556 [Wickerhamiella sorbophila]PRT54936.1 hypothetical protein B9G98_02556 [Wickerhamiella sorbophila]
MISRVLCRRMAVARFSTSVPRKDLLQDLYLSEIKAFKPKPVSESDAAGTVKKFAVPAQPKSPSIEGDAAEVDAYANSTVEVETETASGEPVAQTSEDWFPIEEVAEAH